MKSLWSFIKLKIEINPTGTAESEGNVEDSDVERRRLPVQTEALLLIISSPAAVARMEIIHATAPFSSLSGRRCLVQTHGKPKRRRGDAILVSHDGVGLRCFEPVELLQHSHNHIPGLGQGKLLPQADSRATVER